LIVVKVHNISCLLSRLTKKNFYAICPPGHLFYFNDKTLRIAMEKAGFRAVDTRFIGNKISLKTIPYRLAHGNKDSIFHKVFTLLDRTRLGDISFRKNLFDIITVLGIKEKDVSVL